MHHFDLPDFPTRDSEYEYLAANRWADGNVACPRCKNANVGAAAQARHYFCKACAQTTGRGVFNAMTGTALAGYKPRSKLFCMPR